MKHFIVDGAIFELFPESVYGVLLADNIDNYYQDGAWYAKLLRGAELDAARHITLTPLSANPAIALWREAYTKFKTKKGARSSIEALLKRTAKEESIDCVNPLVDIYNAVSLRHGIPAGAEDREMIRGDLRLGFAAGGEPFSLIGRDENDPALSGEIIYKDDEGAVCRGWNWRDGARTMITRNTQQAFMVMELVDGTQRAGLSAALDELETLVRDRLGAETRRHILDTGNRTVVIDG